MGRCSSGGTGTNRAMIANNVITVATTQPKKSLPNAPDTTLRVKNASALQKVTKAQLDKMSMSKLIALARKAIVYNVGAYIGAPKTEAEALRRFDLLAGGDSKTSLKKLIMKGKRESKKYSG